MSAGDFQNKYASFMENMLKNAIAETTQLFETMVDELKAEICRIKEENENLKRRCSQIQNNQLSVYCKENQLNHPVHYGKRDIAVQCDFITVPTMVGEQCPPIGLSSLQNQQPQHLNEEVQCTLQDHNYGAVNSQIKSTYLKREECCDDSSPPDVKEETVEYSAQREVPSAGSAMMTPYGTETEGPLIKHICSIGDLYENAENTRVPLEVRCHGIDKDSLNAENEPSEPEHRLVTTTKDDMEDKTEGQRGASEVHQFETAQQLSMGVLEEEQPSVVRTEEQLSECPRKSTRIAHRQLKKAASEFDIDTWQIPGRQGRPPKRRRGRPRKNRFEAPSVVVTGEQDAISVQEVDMSASELLQTDPVNLQRTVEPPVASLTKELSSTEPDRPTETSQSSVEMTIPSTKYSSGTDKADSSGESPTLLAVKLRERCTSATLQDAMLLVEAMNLSTAENTPLSSKSVTESHQSQCASPVDALQTMDQVPAELQTLSSKSPFTADSLPSPEISTTQSVVKTTTPHPQVTDSTPTRKAQSQVRIRITHVGSPSTHAIQQKPPSAGATPSSVPQRFPYSLVKWLPAGAYSHRTTGEIIFVPMQHSSETPFTISPAQPHSALPKHVAPMINGLLPSLQASVSSFPQKSVCVASGTNQPIGSSQSPVTSKDQRIGFQPHSKIIIIPRHVSVVTPVKHPSQTSPNAKQKSAEPVDDATQSLSLSNSSLQKLTSTTVTTTSLQVKYNRESHNQIACSPKAVNAPIEGGPSLSLLVPAKHVPTSVTPLEQKFSAVVRLTRLPFSISTKESVLVSKLLSKGFPDSHSGAKECGSPADISQQPSGPTVTSTYMCPDLKETMVSMMSNVSQMSENNIQEIHSSKNMTTSSAPKFSPLALDKLAVMVKRVQPSTAAPFSPVMEREIHNYVQTTEKENVDLLQLSSISSKNNSDADVQMSKAQFLPRLVVERPKKASLNESAVNGDSSVETSTIGRKSFDRISPIAEPRSHIDTSLDTRGKETTPEHCMETETTPVRPTKCKLKNDNPNDNNAISKPDPVESINPDVIKDITVLNDSPWRTGLGRDQRSKRRVSEPTWRSEDFIRTTPTNRKRRGCGRTIRSARTLKDDADTKQTETGPYFQNTKSSHPRRARSVGAQANCAFSESKSSLSQSDEMLRKPKSPWTRRSPCTSQIETESFLKWRSTDGVASSHEETTSSKKTRLVDKCKSQTVWTPPAMSTKGDMSSETGKKEIGSKKKKNHAMYHHSIPAIPIPTKAPPVVSPLQPLSVIGERLLKNQCGVCGCVLSSAAALESHVSLHRGRQPFSCTLCGKNFTDSSGLKRHGRVHRNGRIHVCKQCGKGFVFRFCLSKHIQMVHNKIKPFACQTCNKAFFTKGDVDSHIMIHTGEKPFECHLCEKRFIRRVELNVHLRWHNGEKRHWCSYCGKGFLDQNNLKRHKYIHTGEKPHSCPHCPKHFTQSGHLKKHVKNVHKII